MALAYQAPSQEPSENKEEEARAGDPLDPYRELALMALRNSIVPVDHEDPDYRELEKRKSQECNTILDRLKEKIKEKLGDEELKRFREGLPELFRIAEQSPEMPYNTNKE